jgi:DNA-binding response OmpR family regulator
MARLKPFRVPALENVDSGCKNNRSASGQPDIHLDSMAKPGKFQTLILEDDSTTMALVAQAIRFEMPDAVVLGAPSLMHARAMLERYDFDLYILDIQLPDGSGIDFLYDIQLRRPDASVIIVTGTALPEYRDQASAFGVLSFMEKPVNPQSLAALVRTQREKMPGVSPTGDTAFFTASLTRLTTLDIIQLKCLGHATVVLEFTGRDSRSGRVYFRDGEIIHAETVSSQGVPAFNEIVSWRGGQVVEVKDAPEIERTIQGDWQNLLMNAVQWADEHRLGPEETSH